MYATKTATLGALVLLLNALTARAFHVESGTACTNIGGSCSYISNDSPSGSAETTVNGVCAPDGICASNGATCSSDDECYNYCGTDGVCGGVGAGCDTQGAFEAGQTGIACDSGFECSTNGSAGTCKQSALAAPGASQAVRRNKRRQDSAFLHARQARTSEMRSRGLSARKHL